MISDNIALSAGHCFSKLKCEDSFLVFNYEFIEDTNALKKMERYKCSSLNNSSN
jgi:hypothetical protein